MKYNTMFDVAFSIDHDCDDPYDIPVDDIITALEARVQYLKANPLEVKEAIGACDTYDIKEPTFGTLFVETDFDFSLELNGKIYSDMHISIPIESIEELNAIKITGPFGSPSGGKTSEIEEALEAIRANPDEIFNNMGGNRGATWVPS